MAVVGEPDRHHQVGDPVDLELAPRWRLDRRAIGSLLAVIGCFAILAVAGFIAVFAFNSVSTAGVPASVTTMVRLSSATPGGLAQLDTLNPIALPGDRSLPAGTTITTTSDQLVEVNAPLPAAGATMSCALRVGWSNGSSVIDVLHCAQPAANQP